MGYSKMYRKGIDIPSAEPDSDPEKSFPREAFEDHLVKFGCFGLTLAVLGYI